MDEDFCAACIKTEKENEWEFTSTNMEVQNRLGGGINQPLLDRIDELERRLEAVESGRASEESYGLARISESGAVTDTGSGLVLSARQNNAAETGTLANRIENVLEKTNRLAETVNLSVRLEKTVYIEANTETAFTLGLGKTYILALNNAYNVGFLYIASTGRNTASGHIHQLIPSGFFELSALGKAEFKIKSGEANGWMYAICIAGF